MKHDWQPDPQFPGYLLCACGTRIDRFFVAIAGDGPCGKADAVSRPFSGPAETPRRATLWPRRIAALAMDARNFARFAIEAHERMVRR